MIRLGPALACLLSLTLAACASAPPSTSGFLSSYTGLSPHDGFRVKRLETARAIVPPEARLVMEPAVFASGIGGGLSEGQKILLLNKLQRDLCNRLAGSFLITTESGPETYRLRAAITQLSQTSSLALAATAPLRFVSPISVRLPIGLGGLEVQMEILDPHGATQAAMVWRKRADIVDDGPAISSIGDAYQEAADAAGDFTGLVATARPGDQVRKVGSMVSPLLAGGRKDPLCKRYGEDNSMAGGAASILSRGLTPPEWTDKGRRDDNAGVAKH